MIQALATLMKEVHGNWLLWPGSSDTLSPWKLYFIISQSCDTLILHNSKHTYSSQHNTIFCPTHSSNKSLTHNDNALLGKYECILPPKQKLALEFNVQIDDFIKKPQVSSIANTSIHQTHQTLHPSQMVPQFSSLMTMLSDKIMTTSSSSPCLVEQPPWVCLLNNQPLLLTSFAFRSWVWSARRSSPQELLHPSKIVKRHPWSNNSSTSFAFQIQIKVPFPSHPTPTFCISSQLEQISKTLQYRYQ